ncbi:MAG: immunoglobulin domain-containing protein, partial [Chloroflexi bacterium]|nr:immunoglobulin domain-containing protein [Chloroflexota bacterium]
MYARVTDPERITFAPDGTRYAGRDASGSGGGSSDAVKISRIAPGGTPVSAFGNASIADPDAVAYDASGAITGTPGALIVGGETAAGSGQGQLSRISPDGIVTSFFGPSSSMINPSDFVFDSSGRLLFSDLFGGKVWRMTNATPVALVSGLTEPSMIAVDALGRIVLSFSGEERLRLYSATGILLSNNFVTARSGSPLARGPGGMWGTGIYYLDPNGKLISVDTNGIKTSAGSGFEDFDIEDLEFGPDGALYASDFDNDRIFRFAQPAVPNATTTIYARVTDPQSLSFAPDGTLFVGRDKSGSGGGSLDAVKIHRIAPGGSPVTEFGNVAIADPDAVAYDVFGEISGTAGGVIVGGATGSGGRLSIISPDGTVTTLFGPSSSMVNPGDFVFDSAGRLLFVGGDAKVWVMTNATPGVLISGLTEPSSIAVDSLGRILVSQVNETRVQLYSATGASIINTFVRTEAGAPLALGPGGFWGMGVFCVNTNGDLLTVDLNGQATTFGTGFGGLTDSAFGPDGALYASYFESDVIWRIAPSAALPPTISLQPQGQTVEAGQSVTFTAVATGYPLPTYQWRKNGMDMPGATRFSLTLTNVQASDTGDYTVIVSNTAGTVTSQVAALILDMRPALLSSATDILAGDPRYEGRDVTVSNCAVQISGSHQFASLTLVSNAVVTHPACSKSNVYSVDVSVATQLSIDVSSMIDVTGRGYLAGRTMGNTNVGGATGWSGGSYGGRGFSYDNGVSGMVYGDYRNPNELGSGGGGDGGPAGSGGG